MEKKSFDLKNFVMKYIMYIFLVLMCIVLAIASDKFLLPTNLMTIVKQISIQSIVAIGMTMIIITGNIDLSVGSVVAFCSVVGAMLMSKGSTYGSCHYRSNSGRCCHRIYYRRRYRKAEIAFLPGYIGADAGCTWSGTDYDQWPSGIWSSGCFRKDASASIGPVPLLVIYMIVLYVIFIYVMKYTAFGRSIYAVGGNQESARLSGINVEKVKTMVFLLSGMLSGVAGVLLASKVRSGDPTCAEAWEMDPIAGAIIGGTNMMGGEGKSWRNHHRSSLRRYPGKRNGTSGRQRLHAGCYQRFGYFPGGYHQQYPETQPGLIGERS